MDSDTKEVEVDEVILPGEDTAISLFNAQSLQKFEDFGIHTDWKSGIVTLAENTPDEMFKAYLQGLSKAEQKMPFVIGSAINAAEARWGDQYVQILKELTPWKEDTILAYASAMKNLAPEAAQIVPTFSHARVLYERGVKDPKQQVRLLKHATSKKGAGDRPHMPKREFEQYVIEQRKAETPEETRTGRDYGKMRYEFIDDEPYDSKKWKTEDWKKQNRKKIIDGIEEAQRLYLEPTYAAKVAAREQEAKEKKQQEAADARAERLKAARQKLGEQITRIEDAGLGEKVQDRLNVAALKLTWPFKKADVSDKDIRSATAVLRKIKAEKQPKKKAAKTASKKGKKAASKKPTGTKKAPKKGKSTGDKSGKIDTSKLPFSKPGDQ